MWKRILAAAVVAALPIGLASPAIADPSKGLPITFVCDNGETYAGIFQGGAQWNVSLDTGSGAVIVPTASDFHGQLKDSEGNVLFETHQALDEKGDSAGRQPNQTVCSFAFTNVRDDGLTFFAWGTGTFFITPGS
jgi:hypothetical protein